MSRLYTSCAAVQGHLNAFADGELRGEDLRGVSQHVELCARCTSRVEEISELGSLLREGVAAQAEPPDLAGLADGIVSRVRAEDHESWRGFFSRATDDLHWIMVGVGSVTAAFVSALVVSLVVQSGVGQRGDSLAAMLNQLAVSPAEVSNAARTPGTLMLALGIDDVLLTSLAEVNDEGHVSHVQMVSSMDARDAAILSAEFRRIRFTQQQDRRSMTDPTGRQVVLVFSATEVRGKKAL